MGRMYVASVLIAISGRSQPDKVAEVGLKPMTPGAWAAWAKDWDEQQAALTAAPTDEAAPFATTLQPAGGEA